MLDATHSIYEEDKQQAYDDCLKWASKSTANMDLFMTYKALLVWIRHHSPIPKAKLESFLYKNVKTYGKLYQPLVRELLNTVQSTHEGAVQSTYVDKWCSLMQ
jgi:hypothetical protein